MRISGFGTRQAKFLTLDRKHLSCQTGYLVRLGIGRSHGCHEEVAASAVVIMGVDKGINEAHYHDSILEVS